MTNNIESHLLPNGAEVTFSSDTHTYKVGDKVLPSVTTLIHKMYGNPYTSVNPQVLSRAAEYGTAVHNELQQLIEMRQQDPDIPIVTSFQESKNYFSLVEPIYRIEPIMTEKVVLLYDGSEPVAAGRFDLLCYVSGKLTLADFKTTSTIQRQSVTAQLNMYLKAAKQSGYIQEDNVNLGVIHLSGETSKFVPMPVLGEQFFEKVFLEANI